jgi:hypothetical protein
MFVCFMTRAACSTSLRTAVYNRHDLVQFTVAKLPQRGTQHGDMSLLHHNKKEEALQRNGMATPR